MKISEILKQRGVFANEIRSRFKNGQIKLNGEKTENVELNVKLDDAGNLIVHNVGDFLFNVISQSDLTKKEREIRVFQLKILDFESLSESNLNNDLKNIFSKFFIIRFSKKDIILVEKN